MIKKEFWFKDVLFESWYKDGSKEVVCIKDPILIAKFEEIIQAQKALDDYKRLQAIKELKQTKKQKQR